MYGTGSSDGAKCLDLITGLSIELYEVSMARVTLCVR